MRAMLLTALLFWPAMSGPQERSIPIRQSPFDVTPDSAKLWLTVDCAPVEGASPAGCLFILPPSKVIFYQYPGESEVCTAETESNMGIRCVRFDVFKAWLATQ